MALTILQIVPALKSGGVETGTVDVALELVQRGYRAVVISSGGPLVEPLKAAGVLHYTLPVHRKNPITIWKSACRVAEVVQSHGVDVIHARSRVPAFVGFLAWRRVLKRSDMRLAQKLPVFITTAHGVYSKHLFSRVMGWGRIVIANSERVARHMMDGLGAAPDRVRVIPRGVNLRKFEWQSPRMEAPGGKWHVAAIGRLTPIKGHAELLKAFQIVAKTYPRARLSIVGGVEPNHQNYFEELKGMVKKLGLEEQVIFTGHESDIPKFLGNVDLCVLASTGEEAFGRVLIEAGAVGVPVVATRVGGIAEVIVDGKTGLLVPTVSPLSPHRFPGFSRAVQLPDPMAMAQAMTALLHDRKRALELARNARARVESMYSLDRMVNETLAVYESVCRRMRILIIKMTALGDVVLATPSLRAIRKRFPTAHITVLTGRESMVLLHRCPYFDDLVVYDRKDGQGDKTLFRLARKLRSSQQDLTIDLQNNRVSMWLAALTLAPLRFGYAGRTWSGLLTRRAMHSDTPLSPVGHQFRLLELLGIEGASETLELWPGPSDEAKADLLLEGGWISDRQLLVAVHPAVHPRWLSKRWPPERFVELIDRLGAESRVRVVLTGAPADRSLADRIYRQAKVKPMMAVGKTSLSELAAILGRCRVFVSGDTAPLHIAAARQVPLVALFGATDPARHMPPSTQAWVLKKKLACSPCYHSVCRRKGKGYMECMNLISVDEVLNAVKRFLEQSVESEK